MNGQKPMGVGTPRRSGQFLLAIGLVLGLVASEVTLRPGRAEAAPVTVSNCNDSGSGSLRQAVTTATAGETISFALSPSCSTITLSSPIDIGTNMDIEGPGSDALSVSGNNAVQIFDVEANATATISGLTIENGTTANSGGAIDDAGTLTVSDSTLSGNNADADDGGGGGAIYVDSGALNLSGTTVTDNNAGTGGGAGGGAGVDNEGGTVVITSSTLSDNQGQDGGAIDNGDNGNGGSVTVSSSTFSDNAAFDGGGISNAGTGNVQVTGSSFSGNSSGGVGGGAIFNDATMTLTGGTVSDNLVGSGAEGGGIENYTSGSLTVTGTAVDGNSTGINDGAGIENMGVLSLSDSTLQANDANGCGSAIENDGGTATVVASTVDRNIGCGGIYNSAGTVTIADSTVAYNSIPYGSGGSGIDNDKGTTTIVNSTLSGNGILNGKKHAGGGIDNISGTVSVAATIIANSGTTGDCTGAVTDSGYNLDDDDSCGFTSGAHDISDTPSGLDPAGLHANGGPTETIALASGSAAIGAVSTTALCATADQRGTVRPTPCDIGSVELVVTLPKITSADSASATVGKTFQFTVTTTGTPVPSIKKSGKLPPGVTLKNDKNGTATISGTPKKAGTYTFTITATFGKNATKYVANQSFTLTVNAA